MALAVHFPTGAGFLALLALSVPPAPPGPPSPGAAVQAGQHGAVAAARFRPAKPGEDVRYPEFAIVHTQHFRTEEGSVQSSVTVGYRLCSMWEWKPIPASVQTRLRTLAGSPGSGPAAWLNTYGAAGTPADLFRRRGSLLGLLPGERLQFYTAGRDGKAAASTGASAVIETLGDGLYRVTMRYPEGGVDTDTNARGNHPGNIPPSATASAEIVRTPKGAVLWFACEFVPGAGGAHTLGTVAVGGNLHPPQAQWDRVFIFELAEAELAAWEQLHRVNRALLQDAEDPSIQAEYGAELTMVQPADAVEATVEPLGNYPGWIPAGKLESPDWPGNELRLRVRVHKKGDPNLPRRASLAFDLVNVSRNKGVCMNWPQGAPEAEGLRFRGEDYGPGSPVRVSGRLHADTTEPVESVELVIGSYDYGAWGTLRVSGKDAKGRPVAVSVLGKASPDLDIPRDENGNRIADAWEAKVGATGTPAAYDGETDPEGRPDAPGDGLSAYEEYRGFRVQGAHVTGDLSRKDLFVCDDTTGHVGGAGLDRFEAASGLRLHRVRREELGELRIINGNGRGETHLVFQHGILLMDGPPGSDPEAVAGTTSGRFGPPVLTHHIQLPQGGNADNPDGAADVAHELGHAVGLRHHGDQEFEAKGWGWKLMEDGAWRLFEQDLAVSTDSKGNQRVAWQGNGVPVSVFFESDLRLLKHGEALPKHFVWDEPHQGWLLYLGGPGSQFSGDQRCFMRYADKQAYKGLAAPGTVRYIPDPGQWKPRDRFCDGPRGTGVNAPDHTPQPRYGNAAVGDCRHQIVVSDRYAGKLTP